MSLRVLRELERVRAEFGPSAAAAKHAHVSALARATLPSAAAVARLHECLCFLRAYPSAAQELALVTRTLAAFARRRDLTRFRDALEGSGIAGTDTCFRFFQPTAAWLRCSIAAWPRRRATAGRSSTPCLPCAAPATARRSSPSSGSCATARSRHPVPQPFRVGSWVRQTRATHPERLGGATPRPRASGPWPPSR